MGYLIQLSSGLMMLLQLYKTYMEITDLQKQKKSALPVFVFFCATYEASHKMLMRSFIKLISAFISKQTYGNTNIHTTYKSHCSFRHILQPEFQSLALQVSDVLLLLLQEIFL